jgi:hypothetical protein
MRIIILLSMGMSLFFNERCIILGDHSSIGVPRPDSSFYFDESKYVLYDKGDSMFYVNSVKILPNDPQRPSGPSHISVVVTQKGVDALNSRYPIITVRNKSGSLYNAKTISAEYDEIQDRTIISLEYYPVFASLHRHKGLHHVYIDPWDRRRDLIRIY